MTDRVKCNATSRFLDCYVDRELSTVDKQRVEAHLHVCETCAREFDFEKLALRQLREKIRQTDAPPDLIDKVATRLRRND